MRLEEYLNLWYGEKIENYITVLVYEEENYVDEGLVREKEKFSDMYVQRRTEMN